MTRLCMVSQLVSVTRSDTWRFGACQNQKGASAPFFIVGKSLHPDSCNTVGLTRLRWNLFSTKLPAYIPSRCVRHSPVHRSSMICGGRSKHRKCMRRMGVFTGDLCCWSTHFLLRESLNAACAAVVGCNKRATEFIQSKTISGRGIDNCQGPVVMPRGRVSNAGCTWQN